MTQDDYRRATNLLEQIDKISALKKKIKEQWNKHKGDTELAKVLEQCGEIADVLQEIDQEKFSKL